MRGLLLAALLLVAAIPAHGQTLADYDYESLAFRGVGVEAGRIWPSRVEPAEIWVLRIDLGYLGPAIRITPTLSYWSSKLQSSELERLARRLNEMGANVSAETLGPVQWSDLALGVDVQSVWIAPFHTFAYLGLGLGAHALNGQGQAFEDTFVEDLLDSISGGADVMAGLEFQPLPRLRLYGEARYTFMSDVQYPGLRVGGAVVFPPPTADR